MWGREKTLALFGFFVYRIECIIVYSDLFRFPGRRSFQVVKIVNQYGTVSISAEVFTNIAGDAATRCFGVKGMVGRTKESGLRTAQLLRRESMSKGVSVSFDDGEGTVSIALHIAVDQGVNLAALGKSITSEVRYKVAQSTGVEVKRVDVYVDSILSD